jgi:hypothetical protein
MTACRRCGQPAAAAAWAAWWDGLDLPRTPPPDVAAPFCPVCMTAAATVAYLAGVHSVRVLIADSFADFAPVGSTRRGEFMAQMMHEAAS